MKKKQIEKLPCRRPAGMGGKDQGNHVTVQLCNGYLVFDLWSGGKLKCRHVMDTGTGEYASRWVDGSWTRENLENAFCDCWGMMDEDHFPVSGEERALVLDTLKVHWETGNIYDRISALEYTYARECRERREDRRVQRVNELMSSVPKPGKPVYDWIAGKAAGDLHYAFWDKNSGDYSCTSCGGRFTEKETGIRLKHKSGTVCPLCGQKLAVEKRRDSILTQTRMTLIHGLDGKRGIERHFEVSVCWGRGLRRTVSLKETIRCMLHKGTWSRDICDLYYLQYDAWDNRGNPQNRRWRPGYLYPEGIREGLEDTVYCSWAAVFRQMASMGIRANYNRLLIDGRDSFIRMVEYLAKGRFYRLLEEISEEVGYHTGYGIYGALNPEGEDIHEVMYLWDSQKINRLRQENGGINMLEWLQWADEEGKKIGTDVLTWFGENKISNDGYREGRASKVLTPEQLMHYIERQRKESYAGKRNAASVFGAYEDYLSMALKLGKDLSDPMVYRPRELKRRHDELVEAHLKYLEAERVRMKQDEAREKAREMEEKYPGSGSILAGIKPKYEYEGAHFRIMVPQSFYEITLEGMALHHCVGTTERYFDRILQHETYICFLRRAEDPEKPFYTIEVEPGGTIRQRRGMYDGEPDLEEVKPFLQEWQKEIRKRMKKQDYDYAKISAVKREENLEELRQKNNTRVLQALMEDLMEVV